MTEDAPGEVTRLLSELQPGGDGDAADRLLPLLYDQLKGMAGRFMRQEAEQHTLQPTALVHEAYLRLVDQKTVSWQSRQHFLGFAAQAMRRILVDWARRRNADKRGGGWERVTLSLAAGPKPLEPEAVVALDDALDRLASISPRQGRVVELRVFSGLTIVQVAEVLDVSKSTVEADWRVARAWLASQLTHDEGDEGDEGGESESSRTN